MGTLLQKQGLLTPGHFPELTNLDHPGAIQTIIDVQEMWATLLAAKAAAQAKAGAHLLDVNMGVPGIDQTKAMKKSIQEFSMRVDTPLVIDSTDPPVLDEALRIYPGRALINSVNGEPKQMRALFPLAKKYGAAVLCLPIGPGGIPGYSKRTARPHPFHV